MMNAMHASPWARPLPPAPTRLARPAAAPRAGAGPSPPAEPSALEPLFEGRRFTCTECGKCCTGAGEVWVNAAEAEAISGALKLSSAHFLRQFTKSYSRRPGWYMLQRRQGSGNCVFLGTDGKTCKIYGARPTQCLTYPFWPELVHPASWAAEAADVCEGINHPDAPEVDPVAAARMLAAAAEYTASFEEAGVKRSAGRQRR